MQKNAGDARTELRVFKLLRFAVLNRRKQKASQMSKVFSFGHQNP